MGRRPASVSASTRTSRALLVLLPALAAACAAPQAGPSTDPQDVAAAVAAREVAPEDIAAALAWAGLPTLALTEGEATSSEPDDPAYWRGAAWAFNPAVRHARGELLAAQAHSGVAGQPAPVGFVLETVDPAGEDRETQLDVLFDLLGLLGLGRSAATRALADAQALAALGRLEQAAWAALAEADRALAGVGAAQARLAVLEELLAQAQLDVPRIDVLMHSGWVAPAETGAAVAAVVELQHRISMAHVELAEARARLARVAGLPPDDEALAQVSAAALSRLKPPEGDPPLPTPAELVQRLPQLRALALSCGVAEAQLRRTAASRWPRLVAGPRLRVDEDETLVGGVLGIDLAWPGAMDAEMREAEAVRATARGDLEDGLLAALARATESGVRLHEVSFAQARHLPDIDEAFGARWYAARLRFQADPQALGEWSRALLEWVGPRLAVIDGREALVVAAVDLREATGLLRDPTSPLAAGGEADAP